MAIKKKKFKKSSLLYNIKTSEDKTERNLNKGKSGLKPSFKKEKKNRKWRCFPPDVTEAHFRYTITQT